LNKDYSSFYLSNIQLKTTAMKNLSYLIFIVFLFAGCSTDHIFLGSHDLSKTTIDHPITHRVWFEGIPDPGKKLECSLPASCAIKGHCNLMGDIDSEKSKFTVWHWHWDPNSSVRKLIESVEGTITGMNGDSYFFTGIISNNMEDKSFSGTMYINGGTGSLTCIDGECYMTGSAETGIPKWTAEGNVFLREPSIIPVDLPEIQKEMMTTSFLEK
jgi:hypothetical protein